MERNKKIILIVAGSAYHCREVARGVYDYSARNARWDILFEAALSDACWAEAHKAIKRWGADGVIGQFFDESFVQAIRKARLPAVNVSDSVPFEPAIKSDSSAVAALATQHFLDRGIRSLAYCCVGGLNSTRVEHYFRETVRKSGASYDSIPINDPTDWLDDQERIARWLRGLPKPVGILTPIDYCGKQLAFLCRHAGIRVPDDVAILGVGNDDLECSLSIPPLSSVITAAREIGHKAAALLDGMLRGRRRPPSKPILVPPLGVAERQSTNIAMISDPEIAAAMKFIRDHAAEPISVADVLAAAPSSRRTMDRRFLRAIGRTPKEEIVRARISMARAILSQPDARDAKLTHIASQLGFTHYSRFCELFQREIGVSPAEYRGRLFRRD